jgi:hypothetical protein
MIQLTGALAGQIGRKPICPADWYSDLPERESQ